MSETLLNGKTPKFKPLQDNVLIKPIKNEKTEKGVYLPEGAEPLEDHQRGTVIAVGPGRYTETGDFIPTQLKAGQTVYMLFHGRGGGVTLQGDQYFVCKEDAICGVAE